MFEWFETSQLDEPHSMRVFQQTLRAHPVLPWHHHLPTSIHLSSLYWDSADTSTTEFFQVYTMNDVSRLHK
jgi:hypothetical protein